MSPDYESETDLPLLDKKYRRLLFYSRFVLLCQFAYYNDDGIAYGILKNPKELGIPLGSLSPNLLWLRKAGYIEERDGKMKDVYYISEEGKIAISALRIWLDKMITDKNLISR